MKNKMSTKSKVLVGAGLILFVLLQIALLYVLIPFVLVSVASLFGIKLNFFLAVGIVFALQFFIQLVKS